MSTPSCEAMANIYHEHGYNVLPLDRGTKKPIAGIRWKPWQGRPQPADYVDKYFHGDDQNVGLILGQSSQQLFCLDWDNRKTWLQFRHDNHEYARFEQATGVVPPRTEAKGPHVYARAPSPIGGRRRNDLDLDIKGHGGQTVAPTSIHASGQQYLWSSNDFHKAIVTLTITEMEQVAEWFGYRYSHATAELLKSDAQPTKKNETTEADAIAPPVVVHLEAYGQLPRKYWAYLTDGTIPQGVKSRSEAEYHLALVAIRNGWTDDVWLEALRRSHPATKYHEQGPRAARRTYAKAQEYMNANMRPFDALVNRGVMALREHRVPLDGRARFTDTAILEGLLAVARNSGRLLFDASYRDLGDFAGVPYFRIGDALARLERGQYLERVKVAPTDTIGNPTSRFQLNADRLAACGRTAVGWTPRMDYGHDAYRRGALGPAGPALVARLNSCTLRDALGLDDFHPVDRRTVAACAPLLAAAGAVAIERVKDGPHRPRMVLRPLGKIDAAMLDKLAALAGTDGERTKARAAVAADRLKLRKVREKRQEKDQVSLFSYPGGNVINPTYLHIARAGSVLGGTGGHGGNSYVVTVGGN